MSDESRRVFVWSISEKPLYIWWHGWSLRWKARIYWLKLPRSTEMTDDSRIHAEVAKAFKHWSKAFNNDVHEHYAGRKGQPFSCKKWFENISICTPPLFEWCLICSSSDLKHHSNKTRRLNIIPFYVIDSFVNICNLYISLQIRNESCQGVREHLRAIQYLYGVAPAPLKDALLKVN